MENLFEKTNAPATGTTVPTAGTATGTTAKVATEPTVKIATEPTVKTATGTTAPAVKIKVIGVGSAAARIVGRLSRSHRMRAEFVAVDTSEPELESLSGTGVKPVLIGESITGGSGAGTDATLGARSAKASEESIREVLSGSDLLVLVVSLGRGTGSGASVEIADLARKSGIISVCFATTPFSWEGTLPTKQATLAIDALHARCNAFVLIENNLIAQTRGSDARAECFKISDRWLESGVSACCRMLLNEKGRMRVDFAAFRTLFPSVGMRTLFSVGAGTGPNAQEAALEELFRCPLLKARTSVAGTAETLAIHLETGTEPPLAFVSETAQRVKDRFGGDTLTIPSCAVDPALGDGVEICVFGASGLREALHVVRPSGTSDETDSTDDAARGGDGDDDSAGSGGEGDVLVLTADDGSRSRKSSRKRGKHAASTFQSASRWLFEGKDLETPTYIRMQINLDEREKQARRKAEQAFTQR